MGVPPALLGGLLLALAGCSQTPLAPETLEGTPGAEAQDQEVDTEKANKKRKDKIRTKTREVAQKERALHVAQLELKVARRSEDQEAAAHEWKVAEAARDAEQAERELAGFAEIEKPLNAAERVLQTDRAERRAHDARQDLAGILAIYEDEQEASAKEEIIGRYESDVEFAERAVAIQKQRNLHAERTVQAKREQGLQNAFLKAQRAVEREQSEKEHSRVTSELNLMRKEHALVKVEEELEELRSDLRQLKKAESK